jgi:hypothetical protein
MVITQEQEQRALDECRALADHDADVRPTCYLGGEPVFWYPWERSLVPGHIRSESGRREYKISKCCEYCFDKAFATSESSEWSEEAGSAVGPIHGAK